MIGKLLGLWLFGFLVLTPPEAWARRPNSRLANGVVQSIDHEKRTLVIKSPQYSEPVVFVWNERTTFLENKGLAPLTSLKKGVRVNYWYRSPFFGGPFVTKIAWQLGEKQDL